MRVLLDSCVWGGAAQELERLGHDVEACHAWPVDPGDQEILRRAHGENRTPVTLDEDFGELAIVHGQPHSRIARLVDISGRLQATACDEALRRHGDQLARRAIVTVTRDRVRFRPPDAQAEGEGH